MCPQRQKQVTFHRLRLLSGGQYLSERHVKTLELWDTNGELQTLDISMNCIEEVQDANLRSSRSQGISIL